LKDFWSTHPGQRFRSILESSLPLIANSLAAVAIHLEKSPKSQVQNTPIVFNSQEEFEKAVRLAIMQAYRENTNNFRQYFNC